MQNNGDAGTNTIRPMIVYTSVSPAASVSANPTYLCPDLLRYEQLGAADGWRGHLVRLFFRALKTVTGV